MNWIILVIAGLFEAAFALSLAKFNQSKGVESYMWLVLFFIFLSLSMFLLYKASQSLPMGTAYAVWTGIGAVFTVIFGILLFNESFDFWRIFFISMLIVSIVGLKFVS